MRENRVRKIYDILYKDRGPQHWWPADTPFEVCVGAILTQSTNWSNVEKAVKNLKKAKMLSPKAITDADEKKLAQLIRPSLYYNVKARKLKEFVGFLNENYCGKVQAIKKVPTPELRRQLLEVWGLGPETVDSILLYAQDRPSFVVDAYTRRIFSRMGLVGENASYDEVKDFFEASLPKDVKLYKEYHALIVEHGKNTCKKRPFCTGCVLNDSCVRAI